MKKKAPIYFKLLNEDGTTPQQHFQWPLPLKDGKPGAWLPAIKGKLIHCERGYHILAPEHLLEWEGPALWEIEYSGKIVPGEDKCVVARVRLVRRVETWNDRTLRIFAADCAERVLPIYEKQYPDEKRPRLCIEAARAFADGKITRQELAAAWDAARDAARAAARAAAWDAAWAAAWDAARDAARDAERKWQIEHLLEMLGIHR